MHKRAIFAMFAVAAGLAVCLVVLRRARSVDRRLTSTLTVIAIGWLVYAAVYAGLPLIPMTPAPDDVFTIAPPRLFRIKGISCFMHRNTPRRSMSMIRFHSSSS